MHIAPGHGLEDYGLGSQNGLPIYSPVDDAGKLAHTDDLPAEADARGLVGQSILEKNGTSEANEAYLHSCADSIDWCITRSIRTATRMLAQ